MAIRKEIRNRRKSPTGGESYDVICYGKSVRKSILTDEDRREMERLKRQFGE